MARNHLVQPRETLPKIALQYEFNDGGESILEANRAKITNPYLLSPGTILIIPERREREESRATGRMHGFQIPAATQDLCLTLQASDGEDVPDGKYAVRAGTKVRTGDLPGESLVVNDLPIEADEGELRVEMPDWKFPFEPVALHIADLVPIVEGEVGRQAVQKILTNLGYYKGGITGELDDRTRAALRAFQTFEKLPAHGRADAQTCERLVKAQNNRMPSPVAPEPPPAEKDRDQPLEIGPLCEETTEEITPDSRYEEPTDTAHPPAREALSPFRFFSENAYVAPCDAGEADQNPNVIRMPAREFLFLDCGRWLGKKRDFGLIWGRHVYLCKYVPHGDDMSDEQQTKDKYTSQAGLAGLAAGAAIAGIAAVAVLAPPALIAVPVIIALAAVAIVAAAYLARDVFVANDAGNALHDSQNSDSAALAASGREGLDKTFFAQMDAVGGKIKIVKRASAYWAPADDFDWDKLLIVFPDLHLMNSAVRDIWDQKPFDLQAEIDLLDFTQKALGIAELEGKIQFLQIGDSYDLWIGCLPLLFTQNDDRKVALVAPEDKTTAQLVQWVRDIQGKRGNWVRMIFEQRRKDADAYRDLLDPDGTAGPASLWRCGAKECPGHARPEDRCLKGTWSCGRAEPTPCPGHARPEDSCDSDTGTMWRCHSLRCPGHLFPRESCGHDLDCGYSLWQDGGWKSACTGHDAPNQWCEKPGWLNPATKALELLEAKGLVYIYGNHDNYLSLRDVCSAAGIAERLRCYEGMTGVFIEHGHRMEATFGKILGMLDAPKNYDGCPSGYNAAKDVYLSLAKGEQPGGITGFMFPVADPWAKSHDQAVYRAEFAQVWMGRQAKGERKPPHICVIGHTHRPDLYRVHVKPKP